MTESSTVPLPLKYHGGKSYQAKTLISLMPEHLHYVEPYCGGLAVLLQKNPTGVSEVANDIHGGLTNFFRVLQSAIHFAEFQRIISAVPFSQVEWDDAIEAGIFPEDPKLVDVPAAVRFFIACRQSRAGTFDSFAPLSRTRTRRQMNEQASAWMTAVEGLPQVAARLRRVVILNKEALDVIRQEDGPQTLFYLVALHARNSRGHRCLRLRDDRPPAHPTSGSHQGVQGQGHAVGLPQSPVRPRAIWLASPRVRDRQQSVLR